MTKRLNITKDYTLTKTYEESFLNLDKIISTPFNDSKYSTFGNFVSVDPPEFVFMNKWNSIGRPPFAEAASTKISARLYKMEDKSRILIVTKTNPAILVFFFILIAGGLIKVLTHNNSRDLTIAALNFVLAILTLAFDRFIKNLLIGSFERDLGSR
jgi:uncharacterized ion transporter superfamily protein YfcC